jgi:Tfp pilus assembly protein PilF
MELLRLTLPAFIAVAVSGCAAFNGEPRAIESEQYLAAGIKQYENGNYGRASSLLQMSVDQGLSSKPDLVKARKYLAFIHCISGRPDQCREQFRSTLRIDPSFELAANEAGHPIWGPVFRSVKSR